MKNFKYPLLACLSISCLVTFAQGAPPATPIDGGLSLLLLAAGAYGAKRTHDHRK